MALKYSKIIFSLFLFVCGVGLGAAFVDSRTNKRESDGHRRYAINVSHSPIPFWNDAKRTAEEIARLNPDIEIAFGGPSDGDASKQIEEIDVLISQKSDGIVLFSAVPKVLAPSINKASANGIPVVTMISDVESKRLAFVGSPERENAKILVQRVLQANSKLIKPRAKVLACIDNVGSPVTEARLEGLKDVLAQHPSFELLPIVTDEADEVRGAAEIAAALARDPDIEIIFGFDARAAIGAISALKEKHFKKGQVIVTGWDSDEDVLRAIDEGWVHSTAIPDVDFMTQCAVAILQAYQIGRRFPESIRLHESNFITFPSKIEVPAVYVDKSNVKMMLAKKLQRNTRQ